MIRRLLIASLVLAGCGGTHAGPAPASDPAVADQPLASFAATHLMILPVQAAAGSEGLTWSTEGIVTARAQLDSTLERLFHERGLASSWALASDLVRTARRNPMHVTNPAEIRAGYAVRVLERRRDADIPEPMASQLRTLAGFHDARYALVPVAVQYGAGSAAGTGRATLRVAVLDLRGSRLVFIGDIAGPDGPATIDAANAGVATRFVDLIVP